MKSWIAVALAIAAVSVTAQTTATKKEPTAQQGRMVKCNKEAGERKGAERKAFMKECLSTNGASTRAEAGAGGTSAR